MFHLFLKFLDSTLNSQKLNKVISRDLSIEAEGKIWWCCYNLHLFTDSLICHFWSILILNWTEFQLLSCTFGVTKGKISGLSVNVLLSQRKKIIKVINLFLNHLIKKYLFWIFFWSFFFFFNFCPFYQNWGEVHIIFIWDSYAMKSKGLQYLSLDYSILNLKGMFFPHWKIEVFVWTGLIAFDCCQVDYIFFPFFWRGGRGEVWILWTGHFSHFYVM